MNSVATPVCAKNIPSFIEPADFDERPYFYYLQFLFPKEHIENISHLSESECDKLIWWWRHEDDFNSYIGKKAVKHFSSLTPDYIRQQFDRILTDKKIEVEKIDSTERIKEVVFDIFWQLAKEENEICFREAELKKDVGAELKIPADSIIVNTITTKFSHKIQSEACLGITNWCIGNKIDFVKQLFQEKASIKVHLTIRDLRLKETLVTL